jgi:hypothetical protein
MNFLKRLFSQKEIVFLEKPELETSEDLIKHLESGNLSLLSGMGAVTELLKRLVKEKK